MNRTRANEKSYPDVGGGFVEPHERYVWGDPYETTIARGLLGGEAPRGELGGSSGLERGTNSRHFAERFVR